MNALLQIPHPPFALGGDVLEFLNLRPASAVADNMDKIWYLYNIIAGLDSPTEDVKAVKRALLRRVAKPRDITPRSRQRPGASGDESSGSPAASNNRKRIKIDLAEPFEKVLADVLAAPANVRASNQRFANTRSRLLSPKQGDFDPRGRAGIKRIVRYLYEAAHGREVETPVGLIPIAPPVAAFLKEKLLCTNADGLPAFGRNTNRRVGFAGQPKARRSPVSGRVGIRRRPIKHLTSERARCPNHIRL